MIIYELIVVFITDDLLIIIKYYVT
jgi:hypothetical protein